MEAARPRPSPHAHPPASHHLSSKDKRAERRPGLSGWRRNGARRGGTRSGAQGSGVLRVLPPCRVPQTSSQHRLPSQKNHTCSPFPQRPQGRVGLWLREAPGSTRESPGQPRDQPRRGRLTGRLSWLESAEACMCTRPRCPRTEVKTPEGSQEGCARRLAGQREACGRGWPARACFRATAAALPLPGPYTPDGRVLSHVDCISTKQFYKKVSNQSSKLSF